MKPSFLRYSWPENRENAKIKLRVKREQFTGCPNFDAFPTFPFGFFSLKPGNRAQPQFCAWNSTLKALLVFYRTFPAESSTFGHLLGAPVQYWPRKRPRNLLCRAIERTISPTPMHGEITFALKFVFEDQSVIYSFNVKLSRNCESSTHLPKPYPG